MILKVEAYYKVVNKYKTGNYQSQQSSRNYVYLLNIAGKNNNKWLEWDVKYYYTTWKLYEIK